MIDLTEMQRRQVTRGICPTCGYKGFRLGPQGGASINIECARLDCRARFNVVMFGGRCLMGQTIPRESEGGPAWPVSNTERAQGTLR